MNISSNLKNYTVFQHRITKEFYAIKTNIWRQEFKKMNSENLYDIEVVKLILNPLNDELDMTDIIEKINYEFLSAELVKVN